MSALEFPMTSTCCQEVRENSGWPLQALMHLVWFPSLFWPQAKTCPAEPSVLNCSTLGPSGLQSTKSLYGERERGKREKWENERKITRFNGEKKGKEWNKGIGRSWYVTWLPTLLPWVASLLSPMPALWTLGKLFEHPHAQPHQRWKASTF